VNGLERGAPIKERRRRRKGGEEREKRKRNETYPAMSRACKRGVSSLRAVNVVF